ncbi:VOC family protein, partial [Methylobacterium trifolii]
RTDDLDGVLARHPGLFGTPMRMSRGTLAWRFALRDDGALPMGGLLPCLMDWGPAGSPARAMPDLGLRLTRFRVEHAEPAQAADLYRAIGLSDAPESVGGPALRFTAEIATPSGTRTLS